MPCLKRSLILCNTAFICKRKSTDEIGSAIPMDRRIHEAMHIMNEEELEHGREIVPRAAEEVGAEAQRCRKEETGREERAGSTQMSRSNLARCPWIAGRGPARRRGNTPATSPSRAASLIPCHHVADRQVSV